MGHVFKTLPQLARHLWLDAVDARRMLGPHTLEQIERLVRESEMQHTGEICVCVEASLPASYLWRHVRLGVSMDDIVHERALSLFGKLRVWDTEFNNGVLIYLQLAEHCVEIVADRGLSRHVPHAEWQTLLTEMSTDFRAGRYEEGLHRAIAGVSTALGRYFPRSEGGEAVRENRLPDQPVIR